MIKDYELEEIDALTPLNVIEEVARCILCYDAPCSKACPAKTDPARFIRALRFRNYNGAVEILRTNNSMAGICARVCPTEKLCMSACSRCGIDKAIEIGQIQRFITDYEDRIGLKVFNKGTNNKEKIAIVGSGPAGLEAAYQLCQLGYQVTIFEKEKEPGGWMRYGIPQYRLPKDILDKEIRNILETGIDVKLNTLVDESMLNNLKKDYSAVLVAVGKSNGNMLDMFKNNKYVTRAVDILREIINGKKDFSYESAVVIGGGDTAMDTAVSLKKLGVKNVTTVCREINENFLASKAEKNSAILNNISIIFGYTPISLLDNEITFEHVNFDSKLKIKTDVIVLAVGQHANLDSLGIKSNKSKIVVSSYQIDSSNVFAAGDIVEKDEMVVSAIKSGREAAFAINKYLGGINND